MYNYLWEKINNWIIVKKSVMFFVAADFGF